MPSLSVTDDSGRRIPPGFATQVLLVFLVLVFLLPFPALACRYNVRDVGFVDLENEPYHLYCFVRRGADLDVNPVLTNATSTVLRDGNVTTEIVNVEDQPPHPALRYHSAAEDVVYPTAVLVSPDGQSLPCPLAEPGVGLAEAVSGNLDRIFSSPLREAIVRAVSQSFGAVLLIEGTDGDANGEARQTIINAIEEIRQLMRTLPKPIAEAPVLLTLDTASMERERTLLWSLRLGTEPVSVPRVAVLFGRARWIGPMMRGEEIAVRNLVGIFSIIGADCECGLDLAWTQGTRLPVRWGEALQASAAKALGFDPENPLVKIEVGGILGRRGSAPSLNRAPSGASPAAVHSEPTLPTPLALRESSPVPTAPADPTPRRPSSWGFVLAASVVALGAGLWLALRSIRSH